jgi:hypothetical protein
VDNDSVRWASWGSQLLGLETAQTSQVVPTSRCLPAGTTAAVEAGGSLQILLLSPLLSFSPRVDSILFGTTVCLLWSGEFF